MTNLKKIAFTLITVVLIPLLFFVVIEFSLRLLDVGTDFEYFHTIQIDGETYYQENPKFAGQFYPPSLNIDPLPNTFAAQADPETLRVYLLGGSAAMGFPHKNHGIDRHLNALLSEALPERKIEVINTAFTSINSHVVYEVAKSIPDNSAEFAVILMGNNEVVGPYGPGTFNQNFASSISFIRALQTLKRTRLWQLLTALIQTADSTDDKEQLKWQGMQMFTNHGVTRDDPRMQSVYSHYEDNLRDIIKILEAKGIGVLLSSVPVNLRHSAPFLSVHSPELTEQQIADWDELNDAAIKSFEQKAWRNAAKQFEALLKQDPNYADSHFRLATVYEMLEQHDKAKSHYEKALDRDALRFRADSQINTIIRQVASDSDSGVLDFVPSALAFEEASRPFQPGWDLLVEHVHYDFYGNYILAKEIATSIIRNLDYQGMYQPLSKTAVAKRIGFPNHETIDLMKKLQSMADKPPFPGQSNYADLKEFIAKKIETVTQEVGTPAEVVKRRQEVLESGNADWKLHFELAVLNQYLGKPQVAYQHFNALIKQYPHNRESYMKVAELLSKAGKWREVIPNLEQSLHYTRGDDQKIAETLGWLGTAHFRVGDYDKATELLLNLTENHSDDIGLTLRAFGNLIKYSRDKGQVADTKRYAKSVQRYAEDLVRQGKDKHYPLLAKRMAQLMKMAGDEDKAKKWQQ